MITSTPDFAAINAAFRLLTPVQKRHAIARDVLARLEVGQLTPEPQKWVALRQDGVIPGEKADLQTLLFTRPEMRCTCCAIGGAIVALAACEDRVTVRGHYAGAEVGISPMCERGLDILERLDGLFGYDQVRLIERAFEGASADLPSKECPKRLLDEADLFYLRHPDDRTRFLAIWTAIANHPEGLFDVVGLNAAS